MNPYTLPPSSGGAGIVDARGCEGGTVGEEIDWTQYSEWSPLRMTVVTEIYQEVDGLDSIARRIDQKLP